MFKKTKRSIKWVIDRKKLNYTGIHLIVDFWNGKIIEDSKEIERVLIAAANAGKNTPLKTIVHKFSPHGITGVVLLAESHIALHSWPEFDYVGIDIFTCGEKSMPHKVLEYLKKEFNPQKIKIKEVKRGVV